MGKFKTRIINFFIEQLLIKPLLSLKENSHLPFRYYLIMLSVVNLIIRLTITRDIIYSSLLGFFLVIEIHVLIVILTFKYILDSKKGMQKIADFIEKCRKKP